MSYPGQEPQTAGSDTASDNTLRIMAPTFIAATVIIGVVVAIVLGLGSTNLAYIAVTVVLVAAGFAAAMTFGYRAPSSTTNGQSPYVAAFFRRMVMTETPIMLGLVISFLAQSALPYLVALPFSVASMWVHLMPSAAARRRWDDAARTRGK